MNGKPNPTENFLVSTIAAFLSSSLRPVLYVMRSHMGVQHTALIPVIMSGLLVGAGLQFLPMASEVNQKAIILYLVMVVIGYLRNTFQARRRRKTRDWSVSTWSSGESHFEPVLLFVCRRLYQRWGHNAHIRRYVSAVLRDDFIYYVAEPVALLLAAGALWSIGSTLFYYPILLAITCIVVRNDAQLWLYLKAHEIPDGKRLERAVKWQLDGPEPGRGDGVELAQIAEAPRMRWATDDRSVFDRLSPELQDLLMKDRITHSENKRTRSKDLVSDANHP